MIQTARRTISIYGALAAMGPKNFMAYSIWVWMSFFVQIIAMTIFSFFWHAIYADQTTLSGLNLDQTLNYILLAQVFTPLAHNSANVIFFFGSLLREGAMGIELLRPLDFQGGLYTRIMGELLFGLILQLPLALIGGLFFGLHFPTDAAVWGAFWITVLLGQTVLFLFDWILACMTFYTTEVWGFSVVRFGIALFASGSLVPLVMMPGWLQSVVGLLPFAQGLYYPVSILSGITPVAEAPRLWALQLVSLISLGLFSRWFFAFAVRKITIQGG